MNQETLSSGNGAGKVVIQEVRGCRREVGCDNLGVEFERKIDGGTGADANAVDENLE